MILYRLSIKINNFSRPFRFARDHPALGELTFVKDTYARGRPQCWRLSLTGTAVIVGGQPPSSAAVPAPVSPVQLAVVIRQWTVCLIQMNDISRILRSPLCLN